MWNIPKSIMWCLWMESICFLWKKLARLWETLGKNEHTTVQFNRLFWHFHGTYVADDQISWLLLSFPRKSLKALPIWSVTKPYYNMPILAILEYTNLNLHKYLSSGLSHKDLQYLSFESSLSPLPNTICYKHFVSFHPQVNYLKVGKLLHIFL